MIILGYRNEVKPIRINWINNRILLNIDINLGQDLFWFVLLFVLFTADGMVSPVGWFRDNDDRWRRINTIHTTDVAKIIISGNTKRKIRVAVESSRLFKNKTENLSDFFWMKYTVLNRNIEELLLTRYLNDPNKKKILVIN